MSDVRIIEHDGQTCVRLSSTAQSHRLPGDRALLTTIGSLRVVAVEKRWTGCWYLYDAASGDEIGSIRCRVFPFVHTHPVPLEPVEDC